MAAALRSIAPSIEPPDRRRVERAFFPIACRSAAARGIRRNELKQRRHRPIEPPLDPMERVAVGDATGSVGEELTQRE